MLCFINNNNIIIIIITHKTIAISLLYIKYKNKQYFPSASLMKIPTFHYLKQTGTQSPRRDWINFQTK